MKQFIYLAAGLIILAGCSSAPKDDGTISEVKNRAAEYAEFGNRYYLEADYSQALKFFALALEMNISVDNESGIAESYSSLGKVYLRMGEMARAESSFLTAYDLSSGLPAEMKMKTSGNLAEYWLISGEPDKALTYINEGLTYSSETPKTQETAILYHNAGAIYKHLDQYFRSEEYLEKALEINTKLSSFGEMAANYYLLSSVYSKQNKLDQAIEYADLALEYDKKVENRVGIAGDMFALGLLYQKAGKDNEAFTYYEKAYQVYETLDIVSGTRKALEVLIILAEKLGNEDKLKLYSTAKILLEDKIQS